MAPSKIRIILKEQGAGTGARSREQGATGREQGALSKELGAVSREKGAQEG